MSQKLGLSQHLAGDPALVQDLLTLMADENTDFTLTFRRLSELANAEQQPQPGVREQFELPEAFTPWLQRWRQRLGADPMAAGKRQANMLAVNPVYIPRNHLVEETIAAAIKDGDFEPFHTLVNILSKPYDYSPQQARYAIPPQPEQVVKQTFCGT
jgi:uncharacterized protein YdiU (UPF0061 family)